MSQYNVKKFIYNSMRKIDCKYLKSLKKKIL